MKRTIEPGETPGAWSPDALYAKAQRYVEKMIDEESDTWEYLLWSCLALEFLARAALANISPAFLADTSSKNWSSLLHSMGFEPREPKFSPKSIAISEVSRRLGSILPQFEKELGDFCVAHAERRNSELHSGDSSLDGIAVGTWQPTFFRVCEVLLQSMDLELEDFLGAEEADGAERLLAAAADEKAVAVKDEVDAHSKAWAEKPEEERATLVEQARLWASRHAGHRVACPACSSPALVTGEPISIAHKKIEGDEITETQEYLPSRFECIACGLRINGLSKLSVVGLGDRYKNTSVYDAAEYYAPDDPLAGYEEDNNEPF